MHITRCFGVAAQFPGCRERMLDLKQLIKDLCRILYFKVHIHIHGVNLIFNCIFQHLTKLCSIATECISAFAVDGILQVELLKAGALWHLLLFMFNYDFTLDEGGVERTEDANQQEISNRLAKEAVKACASLGGYIAGPDKPPRNDLTRSILDSLLTPYLANQLGNEKPENVSS